MPDKAEKTTILELDDIVDTLWFAMASDPSVGIKIPIEKMKSTNGFYSIEVLKQALKVKIRDFNTETIRDWEAIIKTRRKGLCSIYSQTSEIQIFYQCRRTFFSKIP